MAPRKLRRIVRPATPEERTRHADVRRQIAEEMPELLAVGRASKARAAARLAQVQEILNSLRRTRESAGMTLADVGRRMGIGQPSVSRLENGRNANPTIRTLLRYADAVGAELKVSIESPAASSRKP